MALDLNEYIKISYERPNRKVLEGLGASEDLIEYLMETPGNTNWNMVESIGGNKDSNIEVWFTGNTNEWGEFGVDDYLLTVNPDITEQQLMDLYNNPGKYLIYINDILLSCNEINYNFTNDSILAYYDANAEQEDEISLSISNSDLELPNGYVANISYGSIEIKVALNPNYLKATINLTTSETGVEIVQNNIDITKGPTYQMKNIVYCNPPYIDYNIKTANIISGTGEVEISRGKSIIITAQTDVIVDLTFNLFT